MKKQLLIAALLVSACTSLENEQPLFEQSAQLFVKPFLFEDNETKTVVEGSASGLTFHWLEGDAIGVFSSYGDFSGNQIKFINKSSGEAATASFDGSGWSFNPEYTYVAYYPYDAANLDHTAIPVTFNHLVQTANDSANHLAANDFIYATNEVASECVTFSFNHLSCAIRIKITIPTAVSLNHLSLNASSPVFPTKGYVNISTGQFTPDVGSKTDHIELDLNNIEMNESNNYTLTAWLMIAPVDLSGQTLEIVAMDTSDNEYSASVLGKDFQAGKAYRMSATANEIFTFVDLGLPSGTRWANMNLGASHHDEVGGYYTWGATSPTNGNYLQDYWDYHGPSYTYVSQNDDRSRSANETTCGYTIVYVPGKPEPNIAGTVEHDAAFVAGKGVLPTYSQAKELGDYCVFTDLKDKGVRVTSKINGNSIFIPYSGYRTVGATFLLKKRYYIWLSQLGRPGEVKNNGTAYVFQGETDNSSHNNLLFVTGAWPRFYGMCIRPVATF